MKTKTKIIIVISLIVLVFFVFALYWTIYLKIAHSTFENYYKFRGCTELIKKTSDYAFCKTESGEIIKIVKYQNQWYLDGDLPCGFLCF